MDKIGQKWTKTVGRLNMSKMSKSAKIYIFLKASRRAKKVVLFKARLQGKLKRKSHLTFSY